MRFRAFHWLFFLLLVLPAYADSILGTAGSFGVLAGSNIANVGASTVTGNVGVAPGTVITGFPPGAATGTIYTERKAPRGQSTPPERLTTDH